MKYILIIFLLSSIFFAFLKFDKTVQSLQSLDQPKSSKQCGLFVYYALRAAVFNPDLPMDSYQYWSDWLLLKFGYKKIKNPSSFKVGDIIVIENNYSHPQGNMAM